jgi:uncharacterized protein YeaO (DUF488 family)
MVVRIKRVYEPVEATDGRRYLVDRLWPRGISKERLDLTEWLKELAPSQELRAWYGHDPSRYREFERRYHLELGANRPLLERLLRESRSGAVTLLFASKDPERCNASVLQALLAGELRELEAVGSSSPGARGVARPGR